MWPDGVSSSGFHFLIGYVISVRDTEEFAETSHLHCLQPKDCKLLSHGQDLNTGPASLETDGRFGFSWVAKPLTSTERVNPV